MVNNILIYIFNILEKLNDLANVIQNIGLALLTILIPLAIAILTNVYRKREDQNIEFRDLDLHVILDEIFKIRKLLIYTALIFCPFILWEISSGALRFIEIIFSTMGICLIIRTLLDIYRWTKGDVFDYRFSYLKSVKNYDDLESVWHSVWQTKNINTRNEKKFLKIFSSTINYLLEKNEKNLEIIAKLLNDFNKFVNNRSFFSALVLKEIFPKILEWHFRIWRKVYKYIGKEEEINEWINYDEIYRILDSIFQKIEERALKERAFYFFNYFKKHEEKYKKEFVISKMNKKFYYRDFLFTSFYKVFFENIEDSLESGYIWKNYFPKEWKITKNNLENEENIIWQLSWHNFRQWAKDRIWRAKEEFDKDLDNVSSNLFPEVEPTVWAKFLIFIFSQKRIISTIERSWNFGLDRRIRTFSGPPAESKEEFSQKIREKIQLDEKTEVKNTFELVYYLAKMYPMFNQFSKENLKKYKRELKKLKYPEDPKKEYKRSTLFKIFTEMLKFLRRKNVKNQKKGV